VLLRTPRFADRVFTPAERVYCDRRGLVAAQHYAARFAAKEAALKALQTAGVVDQLAGRRNFPRKKVERLFLIFRAGSGSLRKVWRDCPRISQCHIPHSMRLHGCVGASLIQGQPGDHPSSLNLESQPTSHPTSQFSNLSGEEGGPCPRPSLKALTHLIDQRRLPRASTSTRVNVKALMSSDAEFSLGSGFAEQPRFLFCCAFFRKRTARGGTLR